MGQSRHGDDEQSAFASALAGLKRSGCNVLVVGAVPERERDAMSARLFGDPAAGPRVRLFGLLDRGVEVARRRLSLAGPGAAPVRVVTAGTGRQVRATAAASPTEGLTVRRAGDPDEFREELVAAVDALGDEAGDLEPGALRVGVDSVQPLVERRGVAAVESLVDDVGAEVVDAGGIAHYVYPAAHDDAAEVLGPSFDAVVSLRVRDGRTEQHWQLPGRGIKTGWFRFGDATRDA